MKNFIYNPLIIIALALTIIEGIMGWVAKGIEPVGLRWFLSISMVSCFASIILGFFYIIIKHPTHLYHPGEFPPKVYEKLFTSDKVSVDYEQVKKWPSDLKGG